MTIWTPTLSGQGPLYQQLAEAIARDINAGTLAPEQRLPTHRALAERLGVTVGTVTRGYALAERQGWLHARVGAGTYVRPLSNPSTAWHLQARDPQRVEMWQNFPIAQARQEPLQRALQQLQQDPAHLNQLMDYGEAQSPLALRQRLCHWLAEQGITLEAERLFFTYGVQHGQLLSLLALGLAGGDLLCEGMTYPGLKNLAATLNIQLKGLPMDEEGLEPAALERACSQGQYRALYLVPTLQNPTAATMSLARRQAILAICQHHRLLVIEDDVHGLLPPQRPPLMASLAPEQVIYLGSLSKGISAGLRLGYAQVPSALMDAFAQAVRASSWMISPLLVALACDWLQQGEADQMLQFQRTALAQRGQQLMDWLGDKGVHYQPGSMHAWLPLPAQWRAEAFVRAAREAGVVVAGGEAFAAGHFAVPQGVRLSISQPLDGDSLARGLAILRQLLESTPGSPTLL